MLITRFYFMRDWSLKYWKISTRAVAFIRITQIGCRLCIFNISNFIGDFMEVECSQIWWQKTFNIDTNLICTKMLRKRYPCSSMIWAKILTPLLPLISWPSGLLINSIITKIQSFSISFWTVQSKDLIFCFNLSRHSSQWTFSSWLTLIYCSPSK